MKKPLLIAGFDGWGNALNISNGMAAYLIRKLNAKKFATVIPDVFYRFDESRPLVNIEDGDLKSVSPPGGAFYATRTDSVENDLVILKADEPDLRWFHFVDELFTLCRNLGVETIITLGSMYDNVLHTDRIVSGLASAADMSAKLKEKNVNLVSYQGPSAIHSVIHSEGIRRGFQCFSLWCHCPYYLQGTTHFGLMAHLGALLSFFGEFELDTKDLEENWEKLNEQIQGLIENNSELQAMITNLRKAKVKGMTTSMKAALRSDEKVINLQDFLDPK